MDSIKKIDKSDYEAINNNITIEEYAKIINCSLATAYNRLKKEDYNKYIVRVSGTTKTMLSKDIILNDLFLDSGTQGDKQKSINQNGAEAKSIIEELQRLTAEKDEEIARLQNELIKMQDVQKAQDEELAQLKKEVEEYKIKTSVIAELRESKSLLLANIEDLRKQISIKDEQIANTNLLANSINTSLQQQQALQLVHTQNTINSDQEQAQEDPKPTKKGLFSKLFKS